MLTVANSENNKKITSDFTLEKTTFNIHTFNILFSRTFNSLPCCLGLSAKAYVVIFENSKLLIC
jgi:hypothetical protein